MNNTQPYDARDERDDAFFSKPSFWLGVLVALVLWLLWTVLISGTTTLFVQNTPTAQQTASALSAIETARDTFEERDDEAVVLDVVAQVETIVGTPVPREVYTPPVLYTPPAQPVSTPIETTPVVVPVPVPAPVVTPGQNPTPGVQETYTIPFIGIGGGGGGGGSAPEPEPESDPEPEPEPESDPDPDPVPDAPVIVTPADLEQIFSTTAITFVGTATSNATIEVVYGALESSAETTADAEGNWTLTITFTEGESNISVTATTDAGTSDPLTATIIINVPPSVPVVDAVDTPSVVEDITFTGTGTAGNTISCACGNPEPDTTTVLEDGTWSMGPLFFANGSTTTVSFTHIEPGEGGLVSGAVSFDVIVELAEDPPPGDGPGGGPDGGGQM